MTSWLVWRVDRVTSWLWRVNCVTSWPCDELVVWRVDWHPVCKQYWYWVWQPIKVLPNTTQYWKILGNTQYPNANIVLTLFRGMDAPGNCYITAVMCAAVYAQHSDVLLMYNGVQLWPIASFSVLSQQKLFSVFTVYTIYDLCIIRHADLVCCSQVHQVEAQVATYMYYVHMMVTAVHDLHWMTVSPS